MKLSLSNGIKAFSFFILLCVIAVCIYFSKFLWDSPFYDSEEYITFLQQPKNITTRDFTAILDSMKPKEIIESIPNNTPQEIQKQEITESPPPKPLKLSAILNHRVLINDTWYQLGDTISYNNETFKIQTILEHSVKLVSVRNRQHFIVLEIFPQHDSLFFESFEH